MQVSAMETCATVEEILGKMNEQVDALKEKNDNVSLASEVAKGTDGGDGTIDDDHNIRFIRMFQEKEGVQGNARMVACKKTRAKAADEPEATLVSKKSVGVKRGAVKISPPLKPTTRGDTARQRQTQKNRNGGPTKSAKLKRKLTFENQDSASTEGSDVCQTEHGSLFTYHTHLAFHVASDMPQCLELAFRPPDGMHFQGSEFVMAAYIFSKNMDEREILVADEHAQGDRRTLWSLRPGQQVVDDVINMVASMLSFDNMSPKWFLPTTFAQIALSPVNHSIDTFEFIRSNFMGYADNLHRIYVPMYREQHWYLMIVDLVFCRLIYLDSAKNVSEYEARIAQMKYVSDKGHYKPHPSTFDLDEPEVGHQIEGSNDCGVWVVQWMMQSWVFRDFMLEDVTNQTRMWLALDLVMGRHNPIAREVGRKAMADWDRNMSRSKRRHNGNNAPADAGPSRSGSLTF
ncbi:hypothetical protein HN51_013596 [Arachis hypogaea]